MFRYEAPRTPNRGRLIWNRVLLSVFALCIPLTVTIAADNLMFRMPQFYNHEFDQAKVEERTGLRLEKEALAAVFTDFSRGIEKEFSFKTEYRGRQQEVFQEEDQAAMEYFRKALNKVSILGGICLITGSVICICFIRAGYKEAVRMFFSKGMIFFAVWIVLTGAVLSLPPVQGFLQNAVFGMPFSEDGILVVLLTSAFFRRAFIVRTIVAAILLAVSWLVVRSYTKPRLMFR